VVLLRTVFGWLLLLGAATGEGTVESKVMLVLICEDLD
jgi:hypothetical protein